MGKTLIDVCPKQSECAKMSVSYVIYRLVSCFTRNGTVRIPRIGGDSDGRLSGHYCTYFSSPIRSQFAEFIDGYLARVKREPVVELGVGFPLSKTNDRDWLTAGKPTNRLNLFSFSLLLPFFFPISMLKED